ncbi:MAG: sugar phosphate nucleotidyltransferase [Lamprobacter sp.]|uniref:CBS domain-containing protein n=1 Tax=Lamprobacter sp. TaxID=3100796 RepID=UPI002B262AAB|nr:sugar phosphate nucleotidyltransferase [Lamprobacter sp.]MEA3642539.1 sugar phosphate nucleotidyltransferase [Lamprobacter sp.]
MSADVSVEAALQRLGQAEHGTLMVLGAEDRLLGILADVDLRKYILKPGAMDAPVGVAMNRQPQVLTEPFYVAEFVDRSAAEQPIRRRMLPCVAADWRLIGVVAQRADVPKPLFDNRVVIMVGGKGLRLRPLTEETPKPMLPIPRPGPTTPGSAATRCATVSLYPARSFSPHQRRDQRRCAHPSGATGDALDLQPRAA